MKEIKSKLKKFIRKIFFFPNNLELTLLIIMDVSLYSKNYNRFKTSDWRL